MPVEVGMLSRERRLVANGMPGGRFLACMVLGNCGVVADIEGRVGCMIEDIGVFDHGADEAVMSMLDKTKVGSESAESGDEGERCCSGKVDAAEDHCWEEQRHHCFAP